MKNLILTSNHYLKDKNSEFIYLDKSKSISKNISDFISQYYHSLDDYDVIYFIFDDTLQYDFSNDDKISNISYLNKNLKNIYFDKNDFFGKKHKSYIQQLNLYFLNENEFCQRKNIEPFLDKNLEKSIFIMQQIDLDFKNKKYQYDDNLSIIVKKDQIINKNYKWWKEFKNYIDYLESDLQLSKKIDIYMAPVWPLIFMSNKSNFNGI